MSDANRTALSAYLPVSISMGRIPVLNNDIRERRRDIHLIIISFWFKYIFKLCVRPFYRCFLFSYIIINKFVFNFPNVTP